MQSEDIRDMHGDITDTVPGYHRYCIEPV